MSSTKIWKVGPASVGVLRPCKTSESNLCLQETVHCSCSFNACLPRPQTSILALAPWTCPLQKLNGPQLQVPRQQQRWFVLSRQSQLWKRGSKRSTTAIARCHVGRSATPLASFAPSTSSIEFEVPQEIDPVVYISMQQPPSRKAKKPLTKLEGRYFSTKIHRQQRKVQWKPVKQRVRRPLPCPVSYSNPCITSVYASHLLVSW